MRCPKCSHNTFTKKWGTCTAEGCSLNNSVARDTAAGRLMAEAGDRAIDACLERAVVMAAEAVPVIQAEIKRDISGTRGRPRKWASETERKRAQRAKVASQ